MAASSGSKSLRLGLVGGQVDVSHSAFEGSRVRVLGSQKGKCEDTIAAACGHETPVAGILCAQRTSPAPAICPDCELVVCPVFGGGGGGRSPVTNPAGLATAMYEVMDAGVRIINLSLSLSSTSLVAYQELDEACDEMCRRGVVVVVACGNLGRIGAPFPFRHPWVIPVAACDAQGRLIPQSNIGPSVAARGMMAPGDGITSTAAGGGYVTVGGTSFAVPFVVGAIALLWSLFPGTTAAELRHALISGAVGQRGTIVPRMLNARRSWQILEASAKW